MSFSVIDPNLIGKSSSKAIPRGKKIISIQVKSPFQLTRKDGSWGKIPDDRTRHKTKHPIVPSSVFSPTLILPKAFPHKAAAASPKINKVRLRKADAAKNSLRREIKLQTNEPAMI